MRTRTRAMEWVVTWLLIGVLLAAGFLAVVFQRDILTATGLTRDGAPSTIDAALFAPDPTPTATPPAAGTGLVDAAEEPTPGAKPARKALEAKLAALDTSQLVRPEPETGTITPAFEVIDVETGEVLAARGNTQPLIPASNTKTLTTLAVMNAFTGDETFATTVVQPAAGQIVLVGGGDPMLASIPAKAGVYPQPATTQELAARTAEALKGKGQASVTLGFDASLFTDPGWNSTWPGNYRDQVTQLSALWVDEGRVKGARSRTPAAAAATIFAEQLTAAGITVTGTPAPVKASGAELARVESLPVHVLVETAMNRSNNSFTEVLGFQLAIKTGRPATFAGSVAAIQAELTKLGLWDQGMVLHDASGLSRSNLVTAQSLSKVVRALAVTPRLSVILDGLPTAGVTGTLADRFTDDISRPARGIARAKTGTLSQVSTLGGTTLTRDGRLVAFAFFVNGSPAGGFAKIWADQATGVVASCGC